MDSSGTRSSSLELAICDAIDVYSADHPDLMLSEIMTSLDTIYKVLDVALRKHGDTAQVIALSSAKGD